MEKLKNGTVSKISGTSLWKVEKSFYWLIDYFDKDKWMIIAKKGFICDYGSIPRIFRPIFDPTRYNSYVIHDASYKFKRLYSPVLKSYTPITRKEADLALLEGLNYEGASTTEKVCIYLAVRMFGWIAWNS